MPFKKVTLNEWRALGLPETTSYIHFANDGITNKIKNHKKLEKENKQNVSKKDSKSVT